MYKQVLLQTNISHKPGSQMKYHEIPILSHGNTFKMRYSVGSRSYCGGRERYFEFYVRAVTLCTYMCCFKQAYLTNQEGK